MSTSGGYTSIEGRKGHIEIVPADECRRLLESGQVGRLGSCTDFGPRIVPMSYLVTGDFLTFLTA